MAMSNPSNSFRCTRCSMNLPNRNAYHDHLRTHAPRQSLNTDETDRYIAERRKNFPTSEQIQKKMKADEERQERGDVLETRQFGKFKERKSLPTEGIVQAERTVSTEKNQTKATLLERLLAPDIRRERNMVLQCVRYIVNNNFFGLDD